MERRDNYALQAQQAKKHFLTYDQQELIRRCDLLCDEAYFYITFLSKPYRISRTSGEIERLCISSWERVTGFGEIMVILDWLCDSKENRHITGRWINVVTQSHSIHRNLQEEEDPAARFIQENPQAFQKACKALGGEEVPGADMGYAIELVDGLKLLLQFWYGDEEFPSALRCKWDENVLQYIRYETTWYAVGLLRTEILKLMKNILGSGVACDAG